MTLSSLLFQKKKDLRATRFGFGEGMLLLGQQQENVVALCADLTESTRLQEFKEKYPQRFIELGVAEQNMAGVAAGLALSGKIPFMASYAVFSPGRNWEQIRVSICYNQANVKIAGHHAGVSVGPDGATHQALEDIALMRVLPHMTVIVPADASEARKATVAAARIAGPVYLRFYRAATPRITSERSIFKPGQATILRQGKDVSIIAAGPILAEALMAAHTLSKMKIEAEVINCHTIKPLDTMTLAKSVSKTRAIVTAEEHQVAGGLGSAVAEFFSQTMPTPQEYVAVRDQFGQSGTPEKLLSFYGLTADDIIRAAKKVVARK